MCRIHTWAVPPTVPAKSSFATAKVGRSASSGGVTIRTAESDASSMVKQCEKRIQALGVDEQQSELDLEVGHLRWN